MKEQLARLHAERSLNTRAYQAGWITKAMFEKASSDILLEIDAIEKICHAPNKAFFKRSTSHGISEGATGA